MPSSPLNFDPSKDIPDLTGKIILITGGTAGLGYETAVSLAAHNPAQILFTGRSQPSADKLISTIQSAHPDTPVTFIPCDLASLASVRAAAQTLASQAPHLDVLIANAGVMALPPSQTKDGYEIQFGTNFLSHALLAKLALPLLATSPDPRIIWLTSQGYHFHPSPGIAFATLRTPQTHLAPCSAFFSPWYRYGQSKLALLLYARALARHHPTILSVSVHPGVAPTGLVENLPRAQRWFVKATTFALAGTAEQCAWNSLWAATAGRQGVVNGAYYEPVGVEGTLRFRAGDDGLAERLWVWTERELDGWGVGHLS